MSMRSDQSSRKNDDCYFYYYSTCLKGDNCMFRHEENALGCEVVCQYWKEGECLNDRCNFRHMELKKNRKVIPCYWETQPGGCRKPHCPFRHLNQKDKPPDKTKDVVSPSVTAGGNMVMSGGVNMLNVAGGAGGRNLNPEMTPVLAGGPPAVPLRGEMNYASPSVDPIVVKFEEESDNESVLSTPNKCALSPNLTGRHRKSSLKSHEMVKIKTLEEIRLERVQRQSAEYYQMEDEACTPLSRRVKLVSQVNKVTQDDGECEKRKRVYGEYKVLTLDEIRRNREKRLADLHLKSDGLDSDDNDLEISCSKRCRMLNHVRNCFSDSASDTEDPLTSDKVPVNDDKLVCKHKMDVDEDEDAVKDSSRKQKPIKLRRFTNKRGITDDDMCKKTGTYNRCRIKRKRLQSDENDGRCSNSDLDILVNNVDDIEKKMSSPVDFEDGGSDTVDILRDIDDMLNS